MKDIAIKESGWAVATAFFFIWILHAESLVKYKHKATKLEKQYSELKVKFYASKSINKNMFDVADSLRLKAASKNSNVLWAARAIFSETNKPKEMRYVAWVIRNRVEHKYNGKTTYRGVVLDDKQFSAFNRGRPTREYYMTRDWTDVNNSFRGKWWKESLRAAMEVVQADSTNSRPFNEKTFYFYSEVSMPDSMKHPRWAYEYSRERTPSIEPKRFRFFSDSKYKSGSTNRAAPKSNNTFSLIN